MTAAARPTTMAHLDAGAVEYRLVHGRKPAVIVFHGGHMRAGLALGEDVFVSAGHTVLVPSRPGYGRTPLSTGTSAAGFADVVEELCRHLEIEHAAAVTGISGGGPADAELIPSQANSNFIWLGDDYPAIADTIRSFLTNVAG
jgi:pimeloyl-ACP methyl ester carboxylesterase